jgi:biotin carboxyl carrier protein
MKNFKFKINDNEYDVAMEDIVENIAHIQVNGTKYEVELEKKVEKTTPIIRKARPQAVKNEPVQPKAKASSGNFRTVNSPLPGNILDVKVSEGDKVTKGTIVLIMEAMKMENNIVCEFDGVVASVKVKTGQSVLQNDVLIEIE